VVTDFDQCIKVTVSDHDVNSDDEVGVAVSTVKEILVAGGQQELAMLHKGSESDGRVAIRAEFFRFTPEDAGSFSSSTHSADGLHSGLLNVLIAGAYGIKGQREVLKPSIKVTWGSKHSFQTAIKSDAPGTDINNPTFDQNFRIPITPADVSAGSLRITVLDKELEVGAVDVPFADLQKAPDMTLTDNFDLGNGLKVRASLALRAITPGNLQELPQR
jgi:hypothetical protein